jgi:hypothetical protein
MSWPVRILPPEGFVSSRVILQIRKRVFVHVLNLDYCFPSKINPILLLGGIAGRREEPKWKSANLNSMAQLLYTPPPGKVLQ